MDARYRTQSIPGRDLKRLTVLQEVVCKKVRKEER